MAKKKMRVKRRKKRPNLIRTVVIAGVGIPLAFTAIKKGAETLPAIGKGVESIGKIGK